MKMAVFCFAMGIALHALAILFAVNAKEESMREDLRKAREETLTNIERATAANQREHKCWEENRRLRMFYGRME
jgi:hypothetical protein